MASVADFVRGLSDDPAFPAIIGQAAAANPDFLCDLADSLLAHGRYEAALAACAARGAHAPPSRRAALLRASILRESGDIEQALEQLTAIKREIGDPGPLLEDIRAMAVASVAAYNDCIAAEQYERAAEISDRLLALCPGIATLDPGYHDISRRLRQHSHYKEVAGLIDAATARKNAGDFEDELAIRLRVHRHPRKHVVQGPLLLFNSTEALARLLAADIERVPAESIALARELIASVDEIPPSPVLGDGEESAVARWERCERRLLREIDLDAIFGAPAAPSAPLPTSFLSTAGEEMRIEDVAARGRDLGARAVFCCSSSPEYFARYARAYVTSIIAKCDCACLIFICLCTTRDRLPGIVATLDIDDPRLIYGCDHFDPAAHDFRVFVQNSFDPVTVPAAYYASAALLRADWLLRHLALPVFVSGIDTILQRGVVDLLERGADADVVLNMLGRHAGLGSQVVNNLVLIMPTANGMLFVEFLKRHLGAHLMRSEQPAALDQLNLHMAKHHLMANGAAPVARFFDPLDINCLMFNRNSYIGNLERMRSYRFLNMFVGSFGDDRRLTPEHLELAAA